MVTLKRKQSEAVFKAIADPTRREILRLLRLRHVRLGTLTSFVLFECMIAAAVLLALAELVSWWAVAVLPLAVAAIEKALSTSNAPK